MFQADLTSPRLYQSVPDTVSDYLNGPENSSEPTTRFSPLFKKSECEWEANPGPAVNGLLP